MGSFNFIKPWHCPHSKQCSCQLISRQHQENLGNALTENRTHAGWVGGKHERYRCAMPTPGSINLLVEAYDQFEIPGVIVPGVNYRNLCGGFMMFFKQTLNMQSLHINSDRNKRSCFTAAIIGQKCYN